MIKNTIQPENLFKVLKVEDNKDTRMVLASTLKYLVYLNIGDKIEIKDVTFTKIGKDLIHIDTEIDLNSLVDNFEKSKIIRFPL